MTWLIVAIVLAIAFWALRKTWESKDERDQIDETITDEKPTLELEVRVETSSPDAEKWKREREQAKKAEAHAVEELRSNYQKPGTLDEALQSVQQSINSIASAYGYPELNFTELSQEFDEEKTLKKKEVKIRKTLNDLYKLRNDTEKWIKALAVCYFHAKLLLENPDPTWNTFTGVKRLVTNLDSEKYRPSCIGLLYYISSVYESQNEKIKSEFESEIERLFRRWHSDSKAKENYEINCEKILQPQSATKKHFVLNEIIPYLDMRYKLEPALRVTMVQRCEEDISLYKNFLTEFNDVSGKGMSFDQVLRSKHYICPRLPSFDALWDLYSEERNQEQLARLEKIGSEIHYSVP